MFLQSVSYSPSPSPFFLKAIRRNKAFMDPYWWDNSSAYCLRVKIKRPYIQKLNLCSEIRSKSRSCYIFGYLLWTSVANVCQMFLSVLRRSVSSRLKSALQCPFIPVAELYRLSHLGAVISVFLSFSLLFNVFFFLFSTRVTMVCLFQGGWGWGALRSK